ncbi:MAG TPA: dTMP kinase [Bryobacteraceae bacterium]|jgi:dTMP kinase|nr:dTMP kinase [Bryobacteraceae bacterium]
MQRGRFITFEGIDGSGKTTQMRMLANWLRERGAGVIETVEPGGTAIGQQIRKILLDPANADIQPRTELLLYFASRAQNVEQVIRPGLDSSRIVLCDRFTDSTLVYQGAGRGIDSQVMLDLDRIACRGLKPDLTFLIDIDLETSLARAKRRNERVGNSESRIDEESAAFHGRVREGYLALAKSEPGRFAVIDGRGAIGEVAARIREAMEVRV